jgi:GNAT superfamily N-acetyltransferase
LAKVIVPERKNVVCIDYDNSPVAMCGFGLSDDDSECGFIWGLFVSTSHRRSGLGTTLLGEAEEWIKIRGDRRVEACVAAPNNSAIEFYRRNGYIIHPASGYLRPGSEIPTHAIVKELGR